MKKYVKADVDDTQLTPEQAAKRFVFYALDVERDSWFEYSDYNKEDFAEIDLEIHSLIAQIIDKFNLSETV